MRLVFLTTAFFSTLYAVSSWLTGFQVDAYTYAVITVLALGGVFVIDHCDLEFRRWSREYRDEVWRRREEELS